MLRMNNATIAILLMVVFTLVRSLPIDEEEITSEERAWIVKPPPSKAGCKFKLDKSYIQNIYCLFNKVL